MAWYKYREMWASGYTNYEYIELSPEEMEDLVYEIKDENSYSDKFRKVEYEEIDRPPLDVLEKTILNLELDVIDLEKQIKRIKLKTKRYKDLKNDYD